MVDLEVIEELARLEEAETKLARVNSGADKARGRAHATMRDKTARLNRALLDAVEQYRARHRQHGRPTIARALLEKPPKAELRTLLEEQYGIEAVCSVPADRRVVEAVRKRIERLERSLDT